MKKILVFLAVLALLSSFAFAKNGEQNMNAGAEKGDDAVSDSGDLAVKNQEKAQEQVKEKEGADIESEDAEETDDISKKPSEEKTFKNENLVRDTVQSLLSVANRTGGIGKEVSAIAREFNNGIDNVKKAEQKIQNRGWFKRLFVGGDAEAAAILANESMKNSEMVQQLKDLAGKCNCTDEIKQQFKEQIQVLEQEQTRLKEMADKEKKSKGLFGWMKKEE